MTPTQSAAEIVEHYRAMGKNVVELRAAVARHARILSALDLPVANALEEIDIGRAHREHTARERAEMRRAAARLERELVRTRYYEQTGRWYLDGEVRPRPRRRGKSKQARCVCLRHGCRNQALPEHYLCGEHA